MDPITRETRLAAYQPDNFSTRTRAIYAFIERYPDCTAEEIMYGLGYRSPNNVSPRVSELLAAGHIKTTGKKKNVSGRLAATYSVSRQ